MDAGAEMFATTVLREAARLRAARAAAREADGPQRRPAGPADILEVTAALTWRGIGPPPRPAVDPDAPTAEAGPRAAGGWVGGGSASAAPAPSVPEPIDEPACCRICHGGEEPSLGRLFSPCHCRGTVRHVHVACLNAWRAAAPNPDSFYRCENCLYRYSLARTWWAAALEARGVVLTFTLLLLATAVLLAGAAAVLLLPRRFELAGGFYRLVRATVPWRHRRFIARWPLLHTLAPALDLAVSGIILIGSAGFALAVRFRLMRAPGYFVRYALPSLLLSLSMHGFAVARVFVLLGLYFSATVLFDALKAGVRTQLARFGDVILEFGVAGGAPEGAPAPAAGEPRAAAAAG